MISNKKDKILEVSFYLFLNKGFEGVSISNIKKEANVGSGTIYNYFKSKDELFDAVLNKYLLNQFSIYLDNIRNYEGNVLEKLIFLNMQFLGFDKTNNYLNFKYLDYEFKEIDYRKMHFLYIEGLQYHKSIKVKTDKFTIEFMDLLREIIQKGKLNNEIRKDLDEDEIITFILSTFTGIYFLWINNDDLNLKEIVVSNANHIWNYISV